MLWSSNDAQKPSRGTFGGILAIFLLAVVFLAVAVRVGAAAPPTATAWIECDNDGCEIDVVAPGYEIQEYFVRYVVFEDHRI